MHHIQANCCSGNNLNLKEEQVSVLNNTNNKVLSKEIIRSIKSLQALNSTLLIWNISTNTSVDKIDSMCSFLLLSNSSPSDFVLRSIVSL